MLLTHARYEFLKAAAMMSACYILGYNVAESASGPRTFRRKFVTNLV
jgi:hypothetical protein